MKHSLAAIFASLLIASAPVNAQQPLPPSFTTEELMRFVTGLQAAVASGNSQGIENYISFPIRVDTGPNIFRFVNRAEFVVEYYKVFTPKVKSAILNQDPGSLDQTLLGTTFGNGIVSVASVCPYRQCSRGTLKIIAIDLRGE